MPSRTPAIGSNVDIGSSVLWGEQEAKSDRTPRRRAELKPPQPVQSCDGPGCFDTADRAGNCTAFSRFVAAFRSARLLSDGGGGSCLPTRRVVLPTRGKSRPVMGTRRNSPLFVPSTAQHFGCEQAKLSSNWYLSYKTLPDGRHRDPAGKTAHPNGTAAAQPPLFLRLEYRRLSFWPVTTMSNRDDNVPSARAPLLPLPLPRAAAPSSST